MIDIYTRSEADKIVCSFNHVLEMNNAYVKNFDYTAVLNSIERLIMVMLLESKTLDSVSETSDTIVMLCGEFLDQITTYGDCRLSKITECWVLFRENVKIQMEGLFLKSNQSANIYCEKYRPEEKKKLFEEEEPDEN